MALIDSINTLVSLVDGLVAKEGDSGALDAANARIADLQGQLDAAQVAVDAEVTKLQPAPSDGRTPVAVS